MPHGGLDVEPLERAAIPIGRLDLLLVVDNSRSMADKQAIFALAAADLVRAFANPPCIDPADPGAPPVQPASPPEDCPPGLERRSAPLDDVHLGVISSSLGGHGSDACGAGTPETASNDDRAHLLARKADPATGAPIPGSTVETYMNKGFLAWDPTQKLAGAQDAPDPGDGEADLDADSAADQNGTALIPQLTDMIRGVGQAGCGYESQLESWYRFLVDPEPYETISVQNGSATPEGIDTVLLQQRADFMRPDSVLVVVVLSDENDCSIKEYGQFYYAAQQNTGSGKFHLPRPRGECATNPNDPCCLSCGQTKPPECPNDPACTNPDGSIAALADLEDSPNLRCFDQKRRFGIDLLYPIDRYVQALSSATIQNRAGELVPNPIYLDLNPHDDITAIRDTGLVFFAGIVGVPWQDIARQNAAGAPDLLTGNDLEGQPVGGFKSADELRQPNGAFSSTWDIILGTPAEYVAPADPLMIESVDPRSGTNPITGDAIAPSNAPNGTNSINGHEWTIAERNDLQYACIFDLPAGAERDCSIPGAPACDCDVGTDNPLCEANPNDGGERTLQVRAKAYPGTRELSVIKGVGPQGIVGSVCPAQLTDPTRADFGYRPALGAIVDRLMLSAGDLCLLEALDVDAEGRIDCLIVEARSAGGTCDCESAGRGPITNDLAVEAIQASPIASTQGWDCFCEIVQLPNRSDAVDDEAELLACQHNTAETVLTASGEEVHGWCYIDATTSPPTGNPALVEDCPNVAKRIIRFAGEGAPREGVSLWLACEPRP